MAIENDTFPIDFEIYCSFRNRVTLLQKTAKRSYMHNVVQKKAHPSAIWSAVKLAMYNGSTPRSLTTSSDALPTANELNVHFASIASVKSSTSSSTSTPVSPAGAATDALSLQTISPSTCSNHISHLRPVKPLVLTR